MMDDTEFRDRLINALEDIATHLKALAPQHLTGEEAAHAEPIEVLNLPGLAVNALHFAGIHTVGQLCSTTKVELLRMPNIGRISVNQMQAALKIRGFSIHGMGGYA